MNIIKVPSNVLFEDAKNGEKKIIPFKFFIFDNFKLEITDWIGADGMPLKFSYVIHFNNSAVREVEKEKGGEYPLITFKVYEDGDFMGYYSYFVFDFNYVSGTVVKIHPNSDVEILAQKDKEFNLAYNSIKIILICLSYIMNYPREHKQTMRTSHKYSHEHRVSTKKNKIYLFSDILKYVSEKYIPEVSHHSIQCPCWEVRGHYRHYKSGKVVFIPSYRKGKQRDTTQPIPNTYIAGGDHQ